MDSELLDEEFKQHVIAEARYVTTLVLRVTESEI